MTDVIMLGLVIAVIVFFFALLSASVSINSYHKPAVDDDYDEIEYDEDGIAQPPGNHRDAALAAASGNRREKQ